MKKVIKFIKSEMIFVVSIVLAVVSSFFVTPNKGYIDYIDFKVLAILFCMMLVVEGLSRTGFFFMLMKNMLKITTNIRSLVFVLVSITFFSSMFITNDVALITFVPYSIMVLRKVKMEKYMIYVIALLTIAANLGSMVLPMGNPHNLYLYSVSNMGMLDFMKIILPYTVASFVILAIASFVIKGQKVVLEEENNTLLDKKKFGLILIEFIICILVVIKIIPYQVALIVICAMVLILDKSIFKKADYILLVTFVMFFIFVGNVKNISAISDVLSSITKGNELIVSIVASQFISNVPASILLASFTDNMKELILGLNFGGLGTLIASMANLISYKIYAREEDSDTGKYIMVFSGICILFLGCLIIMHKILG